MSYKPKTLSKLVEEKNRTLFLPHIQRPFVWEWQQIVRFMDSLLKNYPIQTLLFWRTNAEIKSRKFLDDFVDDADLSPLYDKEISRNGNDKTLVLDGQQRLQSLFIVYNGTFEGHDIYINLTKGAEEIDDGLNYEIIKSKESLALPYFRIKDLVANRKNINDTIDDINDKLCSSTETHDEKRARERLVRRTLSQLNAILFEERFFWIEELDGVANSEIDYKAVLDVFIRVNSGGTKLEASDLMFAIMKESWNEVEVNIEQIVHNLNSSGRLHLDKNFVLKTLLLIIGKGPELRTSVFTGADSDVTLSQLEQVWDGAEKALLQMKDFVYNELGLYSERVIRSYNALIPLVEYLYNHPSPTPDDRQLMKSYYYCSQFFNWYSSRTDQILSGCHRIIATASTGFPLKELKEFFSNQRKQVVLGDSTLDMRLRYIILNLIYVEHHGTSPFNVAYDGNEPQIDHIVPKSKLRHLPTGDVNHIGNYRFVGGSDNNKKRAENADSYFGRMKASGIDISRHLLVDEYCDDVSKLTVENYIDFRDKRHGLILKTCQGIINR